MWQEYKLGDVLDVKHGFAFLGEHFSNEGTHIVLTPGNFFDDGGFKRKEGKDKWYRGTIPSQYILGKGDLVVAMTEQAEGLLGSAAIIPANDLYLHNQRIGLVLPKDAGAFDKVYAYYLFNSGSVRQQIRASASGTKIRHTAPSRIADVEVTLPPLPIQKRIAGILSAYDDLIENSQRRIKILEEMARRLYREWFVHFRFPGHEGCRFVESPLGEIPEGWEVTRLGDVTSKIGSGATPRGGKGAYKSEGIHLIRSLNIYDYSFEFDNLAFIDETQAAGLNNVEVNAEDVLINITGASVARCAMVPSYLLPARVNQHVAIVRADKSKASPFYLLDAINSDFHKQQLLAFAQGGATREALTKDTISAFQIVLPPATLMNRYRGIAGDIHLQREILLRQVQNLRLTRDLLLPRLLSGQLDVEALPEPALMEP
jgi:type I restriction enzyme S subunit